MSVSVRSVLVVGPGDAQGPAHRGPYTYASAPRALYNNAKLKREPSCGRSGGMQAAPYSNIMHEKRIVRGSTYAAHAHAAGDGEESGAARLARSRRRVLARRAAAVRLRPGTPPPVPGRRHHPVQTEYYLEELFAAGQVLEVGVQTDLFADRPPSPRYVPARTGADVHTQIQPGDLFDFETEVQPILEALVGKTSEQALAEVAQEEELDTLREQQRRYCELRDSERAERERLAAQHRRLHAERECRLEEARLARDIAADARGRVAAATLVRAHVADMLPSVLAGLRAHGYLLESLQRGVDEEMVPWLVREVSLEVESIISSREVLTEIVRDVVEARAVLYASAPAHEVLAGEVPDSLTPPSLRDFEPEEDRLDE